MIYKNFCDIKLSALGLGCMRLPTIDNDNGKIDKEQTRIMVDYAIKNGINYFDTAFGYHDGSSETVMGEILAEYPREKFYLASKFPGFCAENVENHKEIFEKQLKKCQVEYFDFYLYHCLTDQNIEWYLDEKYDLHKYLLEQKKNGKIKHLGFSVHASHETFKRFLEANGKDLEFCQLQVNWLDWDYQDVKTKIKIANSYGLPVWVMEPVRGGALATISTEFIEELNTLRPKVSAVEWAFRFIQTIPEVTVTLSGMSNFEQLKDNIEIFKTNKPLNDNEFNTLLKFSNVITSKETLQCTACRYCTEKCPKKLDIPELIKLYNKHTLAGNDFSNIQITENSPTDCIGCKACERVCPQNIAISEMMTDFVKKL